MSARIDRQLSDAIDSLHRSNRYLSPAVFSMRDAMTALGVNSGNGTGGEDNVDVQGGRDYADPTGEAAVASNAARSTHAEVVRDLNALHTIALRLERRLVQWVPHAPDLRDLADTDTANSDPGCTSCARLEVRPGTRRWEPRWRGEDCRWCYDWRRKNGTAPPKDILQAHHAGARITVRA